MVIVEIIRVWILPVKIRRRKILSQDVADAIWIIAAVEIITMEICVCSNEVIIVNPTPECCIDARIIAAQ